MKLIHLVCIVLAALVAPLPAAETPRVKGADELWLDILVANKQVTASDQAKFREQLGTLRALAVEFEKRFTTDRRHWDAKLVRLQVDSTFADLDKKPLDLAAISAGVKEIVASPDATAVTKAGASFFEVAARMEALESAQPATNATALAAIEASLAELRKQYPDDVRTAGAQLDWADYLKARDPVRAETILGSLTTHKDRQVSAEARRVLEQIQLQRKLTKEPLDLKFKAVDGTDIDLAKLRGKVVLVDFWATWCGPCRGEIPNVVATYKELHKGGFEVVGISLDRDKAKLLAFTKTAGMTWPQYFDGKMWDNEISTRFGIRAIPAMWLVDKKGIIRSTEARGPALGEQVKKLLAE